MSRAIQGVVSVFGRVLLSGIFLMSAVGQDVPHFNDVTKMMASVGIPAPQVMLAGAIVFLVAGSVSVILGYHARLGAALLLVFLILATYYFHHFWNISDPKMKQDEMIHFMKNLSMAGAMLFLMANGAGAMSLDERRARASLATSEGVVR